MIRKIGFFVAVSVILTQGNPVLAQDASDVTNPQNEQSDFDVVFPAENSDQDFNMGDDFDPMLEQSMGESPGDGF